MPNKVIKERLVRSKSLARCSFMADLIFHRFLLFTDDWGCLEVDAEVMLGVVFPKRRSEVKEKQILGWLAEYRDNGMFFMWSEGEHDYGFFVNHDQHSGERLGRKHMRKTPAPPPDLVNQYLQEMAKKFNYDEVTIYVDPEIDRETRVVTGVKNAQVIRLETFWQRLARHDKRAKHIALHEHMADLLNRQKQDVAKKLEQHGFFNCRLAIWHYRKLLLHPYSTWDFRNWSFHTFFSRTKVDNVERFNNWEELEASYIKQQQPQGKQTPTKPKAPPETLGLKEAKEIFDRDRSIMGLEHGLKGLEPQEHKTFLDWICTAYPFGAEIVKTGVQFLKQEGLKVHDEG